jgi:hypothetical protein
MSSTVFAVNFDAHDAQASQRSQRRTQPWRLMVKI